MDLTPEDALRINVLLAGPLEAVRIDESRMTLLALSGKGEAKIQLNPNCRDDAYLRQVREALSSHVLGSPGGYPVFLKRWTRMGQARDGILESLLMLGEPEAVAAVVNATGITDELARRAWWASQTAENARCMLKQEAVVKGSMGPVLAGFLLEFLPFEAEARDQITSVRLILQGELITADERLKLWARAKHKPAFYDGFLQALPDDLPEAEAANPAWEMRRQQLSELQAAGNPFASQLCRLLSPAGQAYLVCVETVLQKPANQDVMVELMHALGSHAAKLPLELQQSDTIEAIDSAVNTLMTDTKAAGQPLQQLINVCPDGLQHIRAMLFLAMLAEPVLIPVFSRTDAIGTVMRKKLQPVTESIQNHIHILKTFAPSEG